MSTVKILLLSILISLPCYALPDWVKTAIDENKNIKTHPDASVLIMINNCDMQIRSNGTTRLSFRQVFKILKKTAIFDHTFYNLPTTKLDNVDSFSAWVIRTDGSEEEIEEDVLVSFHLQNTSAYFYEEQFVYGMIPRLGVGTIVAYEYDIIEEGETSLFQEFIFQNQEPVALSRLKVEVPEGWELNYASLWIDEPNHVEGSRTYFWQIKNMEFEPEEPLSPPKSFLEKKVIFNCFEKDDNSDEYFSSWPDASRWCNEFFIDVIQVNDEIETLNNQITAGCKTSQDKLVAIAEFVQDKIRYVAIEIGKNKWIPREASVTCNNRYGDCKDKTALMMALLSASGISSYPVLVGSDKPIFKSVTSPYQFNHAIIAIPVNQFSSIDNFQNAIFNECILFDPTNQQIKLGEIPPEICYSGVLIATAEGSDLIYLDNIDLKNFKQDFQAYGEIDSSGNLHCDLKLKYFNATASMISSTLDNSSNEEQIVFIETLLSDEIPNLNILEMEKHKKPDTLIISIKLDSKDFIQRMDSIWVLKAQLLSIPTIPTIKSKERLFPIWFGGPESYQAETYWKFPKNFSVISDSISIFAEIENSKSNFRLLVETNSATVLANALYEGTLIGKKSYSEVIEYSKNLSTIKNSVIVLKRND